MRTTKEELIGFCRYIAEQIERFKDNDLVYDAEDNVFYHKNNKELYPDEAGYDGHDDGLKGYIERNVYDTKLITDIEGWLYGSILQVAGGGPDIRIDTYKEEVRGHWGADECHISISKEICKLIDEEIDNIRGRCS